MRVNPIRIVLMFALMFAGISQAQAQSKGWPGAVQNIELGYGWSKTWADYIRHDKVVREDGKVYDTTFTKRVNSKGGFSGTGGTSIPLKRLGRLSSMHLGADFIYNMYMWDYATPNDVALTDTGMVYQFNKGIIYTGGTMNTGLALSLDFKFGVDAMRDKSYRWGWTGGLGVFPSANLSSDIEGVSMTYGAQPFLKSEVSLRAGIVWKLRMMYAFGNLTYMEHSGKLFDYANSSSDVQLQGKGSFSVSLLVLPFSFTYKKSDWFNTF